MLKFKFCSTQVNVPEEMQESIVDTGIHMIPETDIAGKGRELFPHITVKYGVAFAPDQLQMILAEYEPFTVELGAVGAFEPTPQSEDTAPIIVEVKSPELELLHQQIGAAIGVKGDDFTYRPHLTLAYVKPDAAAKYVGLLDLAGQKIPVNSIALSNINGGSVEVPLGAVNKLRKADDLTPDEFADAINDAVSNEWLVLPEAVRQQLLDSFTAGISKGIDDLMVTDTSVITAVNTVAQDWARSRAAELVGMKYLADGTLIENPDARWAISDTTRDEIRQIVTDAFANNTSAAELAQKIQEATMFSDARAAMIAKTESSMAMIGGNFKTWALSGMVKSLRWLLSEDHDIEDDCDLNDGQVVPFGETFDSGDFYPPVHPNCECSVMVEAIEGIDSAEAA
jgi:hypothetical protein